MTTCESVGDMIYRITPVDSPFFGRDVKGTAKIKMARQFGQGMRARKRRIAKPVKFTPNWVMKPREWMDDIPVGWFGL